MRVDKTRHERAPADIEAGRIVLVAAFDGQYFARIVGDDDALFDRIGRNRADPVGRKFAHILTRILRRKNGWKSAVQRFWAQ